MAQLVLAGAGALIGGALGYPMIGYFIGSTLGSLLFPQHIKNKTEGPRLTDLAVEASTYGVVIPIMFGHVRIAGNLIWSDGIKEHEHVTSETSQSSKKSPKITTESTTYTYTCSFAVGLCEGEIDVITRIWADGKLVWSRRMEDVINSPLTDDAGGMAKLTIYYGTETQEPDPMIEALLAAESPPREAVAHRGLAYVVFEDLALGDFGNRIPNLTFEVIRNGDRAWPDDEAVGIDPESPTRPESVRPVGGMTMTHPDPTKSYLAYGLTGQDRRLVEFNYLAETLQDTVKVLYTFDEHTDFGAAFRIVNSISGEATDYIATWNSGVAFTTVLSIINANTLTMVWQGIIPVSTNFIRQVGPGWAEPVQIDTATIFHVRPFGSGGVVETIVFNPGADNAGDMVGAGAYYPKLYKSTDWQVYQNKPERLWGSDLVILSCFTWGDIDHLFFYRVENNTLRLYKTVDLPGTLTGTNLQPKFAHDSHGKHVFFQSNRTGKTIYWLSYDDDPEPDEQALFFEFTAFVTPPRSVNAMFYHESMDWLVISTNFTVYNGSSTNLFIYDGRYPDILRDYRNVSISNPSFPAEGGGEIKEFVYVPGVSQWVYAYVGLFVNGSAYARVWLERHGTEEGMTLDQVVAEVSERAGMDPADFDVTDLATEIVQGYTISQQSTARTIIEDFMAVYFFDAIVSDNKLKFLLRGRDPVAALTYEDLAAHEAGNERPTELEITRTSELELPREVNFTYIAYETDYQQDLKYARNLAARGRDVKNVEIPIVFDHSSAQRRVEAMLSIVWCERNKFKFSIAPRFIWIDPGDTLTVYDRRGLYHGVLITRMTASLPGLPIEIEGVSQYAGAYTLPAETTAGAEHQSQVPAPLAPTVAVVFDGPAITDNQADTAGLYAVMAPLNAAMTWRGGVLYASMDGGSSYNPITSALTAAPIGYAVTALNDADPEIWDHGDGVTIQLYSGALYSATNDLAVLNGSNYARLGDEIIQYRDVTALGNRRYQLTRLLRGRRGTEWAVADHAAGDGFAGLLPAAVRWIPLSSDLAGSILSMKTGSVRGSVLSLPFGQPFNAANLEPYSPAHVRGEWDGSDLVITWRRRTRKGGGWIDRSDVQLGESAESYEVDIMDGDTVVRTLTATTQTVTYTAAQAIADFGSPAPDTVAVRVYQLSSVVGRGYASEATIP